MSDNLEPFWYKLITNEKSGKKITTGLTIPFIIGANARKDNSYIVNETSIERLFNEIKNSLNEQVAFFQECRRIRQFVIGLTYKNNPEAEEDSEVIFTNMIGEKSLYISSDASFFGNSIEEISKELNERWLLDLLGGNFSWDPRDKEWRQFCEEEKKRIDSYNF